MRRKSIWLFLLGALVSVTLYAQTKINLGTQTTGAFTSPVVILSDGVHPTDHIGVGNVIAPPIAPNTWHLTWPNATTFTGYGWQVPATNPAAGAFIAIGAPDARTHEAAISYPGSSGSGSVCLTTSCVMTTPNIGAATGTSLLASGILDGTVPVTKTTGTSATLGAATYKSGYTINQEATAGTGVTYTLPATVLGSQYCVANSGTTGVVNIGVLTVYPPSGSFVIYNGVVNTVGGGGTHGISSGGAAGDAACFVAIDSTHWQVWVGSGTWTEN